MVARLRGPEGTDVVIQVRAAQAVAGAPRTYKITRGVLPRQTIEGIRSFATGNTLGQRARAWISYLEVPERSPAARLTSCGKLLHACSEDKREDEARFIIDLRRG